MAFQAMAVAGSHFGSGARGFVLSKLPTGPDSFCQRRHTWADESRPKSSAGSIYRNMALGFLGWHRRNGNGSDYFLNIDDGFVTGAFP